MKEQFAGAKVGVVVELLRSFEGHIAGGFIASPHAILVC